MATTVEPGLIKLMNAAGLKGRKLAVGEVVKSLELDKAGEVVPDPHVWGDAENSILMVNSIRDALIELLPEDKEKFTQNAARLTTQLKQLDTWITQEIQTIPPDKRRLVTTHDAFQYYGHAYGIAIAFSFNWYQYRRTTQRPNRTAISRGGQKSPGSGNFRRNYNQSGSNYYRCSGSWGKISTASTLLRFDWRCW